MHTASSWPRDSLPLVLIIKYGTYNNFVHECYALCSFIYMLSYTVTVLCETKNEVCHMLDESVN